MARRGGRLAAVSGVPMKPLRRSLLALVFLLGAACGGGDSESAPAPPEEPATTSTTSSTVVDTTALAPETTSTLPPTTAPTTTAAPVQGLAASDAKAVITPSGVVVPVVGREGDALVVGTPCGRTTQLRRGTPAPSNVAVVIDAGHGGVEPGAVGPA